MALTQLDTEHADLDIKTASIAVLTHTPTVNAMCIGLIMLGDGAKNLSATGGAFQLVITVGGQTVQPSPQTVTFSTAVRAAIWTTPFPVPANAEVIMKVLSPNAADADVDVTAYLYDTTYSLPDAVAGANGGLPTTNGTKINQTVDLTAGQTIAATVADKTGYSLAATGLDLVTAASTFGVALIAGIWAVATSGLTAVGSIGKKLADWVVGTITANQAVNAAQIGGQTVTAANPITVLANVGTAAANTAQTGDSYAKVNDASKGLVKVYDDMSKPSTAQTITPPADMALNSTVAKEASLAALATAANLAIVAGYLDTEVAAIKAKTDNLPSDPADASVIAGLLTALETHGDASWGASGGFTPNTDEIETGLTYQQAWKDLWAVFNGNATIVAGKIVYKNHAGATQTTHEVSDTARTVS